MDSYSLVDKKIKPIYPIIKSFSNVYSCKKAKFKVENSLIRKKIAKSSDFKEVDSIARKYVTYLNQDDLKSAYSLTAPSFKEMFDFEEISLLTIRGFNSRKFIGIKKRQNDNMVIRLKIDYYKNNILRYKEWLYYGKIKNNWKVLYYDPKAVLK